MGTIIGTTDMGMVQITGGTPTTDMDPGLVWDWDSGMALDLVVLVTTAVTAWVTTVLDISVATDSDITGAMGAMVLAATDIS